MKSTIFPVLIFMELTNAQQNDLQVSYQLSPTVDNKYAKCGYKLIYTLKYSSIFTVLIFMNATHVQQYFVEMYIKFL